MAVRHKDVKPEPVSLACTEKPCEGCGIPAGLCEPSVCELRQAIEKAADVDGTAEEYILIIF